MVEERVEETHCGGVLGRNRFPFLGGPVAPDAGRSAFVGGDEADDRLDRGVVEGDEAQLAHGDQLGSRHDSIIQPTELSAMPRWSVSTRSAAVR